MSSSASAKGSARQVSTCLNRQCTFSPSPVRMIGEIFGDVKEVMRECRSELNDVERRVSSRWQGAAEGSLTEGFEVLDSCHKSVCLVKRVWLSSIRIVRLSRTGFLWSRELLGVEIVGCMKERKRREGCVPWWGF